ncbi:MAG: hypothetical protein JW712_14280 [Dehalococcoidales bacterium]|nr:hypothetical protein [Dehalococcoidales bacterium]
MDIPKDNPVIYVNAVEETRGTRNQIEIFQDGTIVYLKENGLETASPDYPGTRVWGKGKITGAEMDRLKASINATAFENLKEWYHYQPSVSTDNSPERIGDLELTIHLNCEGICKTVVAAGYTTPDNGLTYPNMPYPLNDIFYEVKYFGEIKTEEVYREVVISGKDDM